MNSNFIKKYCDKNNIEILYHIVYDKYIVLQGKSILFVGASYQKCLDYITGVIINVKHTNNR